jgi:hypothetical protein
VVIELVWKLPDSSTPLSHCATSYPTSSSVSFGVLSVLSPSTLTSNLTKQNPGRVGVLAGMSRCGLAVKMS